MLAKRGAYFFDQEAVRESLDRPELVGQMRLERGLRAWKVKR